MLGKLAGAWLGEKVAGRNNGAKGAILGYGAAALARRSVPAFAAAGAGRLGVQEMARPAPRAAPTYPSERRRLRLDPRADFRNRARPCP